MTTAPRTAEGRRLAEARDEEIPWRKWGPYLSERQWGTVREDYSAAMNRVGHDGMWDEQDGFCWGGTAKFQSDPHWRDHLLFYEYFHGDSGAGLGASHQTGWTGLVAGLIRLFGRLDGPQLLEAGRAAAFADVRSRG